MIRRLLLVFVIAVFVSVSGQEPDNLFQERLVTYTRCRDDRDCKTISTNSFCFNNDAEVIGKCKCLAGYELVSRNRTFFACLKTAGYGEPCEKNVQCQLTLTENGECSAGTCQCKPGAHRYLDGKCYVSVLLDDFCQSDGNCWMSNGIFGSCLFGRCTCKYDEEVPTVDKTSCVEARKLGELCNDDNHCSIVPNAVCRVSCKCGPGYTMSRDQTKCLRVATEFFELCEENDQCSAFLQGSICSNATCTCQKDQHGIGSRCARSVPISGECTGPEECVPEQKHLGLINCVDGYCQCAPGVVDETIGCNSSSVLYHSSILIICSLFFMLYR
ncbi:hypothetical protein JTB14_032431 [Gonioctena quinquepunctata]|nr:hypothetical protein JTB14_032431 [Gonioctena quinquepunctata]